MLVKAKVNFYQYLTIQSPKKIISRFIIENLLEKCIDVCIRDALDSFINFAEVEKLSRNFFHGYFRKFVDNIVEWKTKKIKDGLERPWFL